MDHIRRSYMRLLHASLPCIPSTTYVGHGIYDEILAHGRQIYGFFQSDVQEITAATDVVARFIAACFCHHFAYGS